VLLGYAFGALALLSLLLTLWQWFVARRFPLYQRVQESASLSGVTLLKPLKGCDEATESCLRSWFSQEYQGAKQLLFAVASQEDPVCRIVERLLKEFATADAQLVICGPLEGTNLKVAKLRQLAPLVRHELLVISDADVKVSSDFLSNVLVPLEDSKVGLVNCFYILANASTLAMRWEEVAINADFWSQVLQSQSIKPLDFALGAVMAVRRQHLKNMGGFATLADCLADDYQLGKRVAEQGAKIVLSTMVVECWSGPMDWKAVWKHQLRWARTIRVCQPLPYFFSILSNASLWPVLFVCAQPSRLSLSLAAICLLMRIATALNLQSKLTRRPVQLGSAAIVLLKDILQTALWALAFVGNRIEWRGERMRLRADGTLVRG